MILPPLSDRLAAAPIFTPCCEFLPQYRPNGFAYVLTHRQKDTHTMTAPKVGIVIPAYNAERYIAECLESALDQDYPRFHIYVVDDASTDDTCKVIEQFMKSCPDRVTWVSREQNRGPGFTRQEVTEMALADGCKYIAPLDADDVRKPNTLACQVSLLEETSDAGICYGRTDFLSSKGKLRIGSRWERYVAKLKGQPEGEVWEHLITYGKLGTIDTIVIRDQAARLCSYGCDIPWLEELDYMAQIATLPQYSRFIAIDEVVASYRFHRNQSPSAHDPEEFPRLVYNVTRDIALRVFHRLEEQGRPVPLRKRRRLWRRLVARTFLRFARKMKRSEMRVFGQDFLMPIQRLEVSCLGLKGAGESGTAVVPWKTPEESGAPSQPY